ncbi:Dot/Icm T4SS effector Wip [Legionella shakespearei]|uniref:WipA-like phosphatase domain-containing protein n=1 Tax=Legionella shakespearei DSM 23087 TaxID=1122169 RepID=A0A0W0YK43_9GAMM|nr:Dot/Icm T4SS effector Wip [Legionella shakespearei]KTD57276.1 hypothetical protein Lsha_2658 [Legionella shakespearei DSM 23087]
MTNNQHEADIYQCPLATPVDATQFTVGDLHANSMLFLYFLAEKGIVKISDAHYERLKNIYLKHPASAPDREPSEQPLASEDIIEFNQIIDGLEAGEKPLVRLIGDEICDRGQNDYFIFKILKKLKQSGIPYEILLSNHSIEFLIAYEYLIGNDVTNLGAPNINFSGQAKSLNNMRMLIQEGLITREEIDELVKDVYKPGLRLLSYSISGNDITLYSHAGIDLKTIRYMALKFRQYGVVYQDGSIEELARTIDAINEVFAEHVRLGMVHQLPVNLTLRPNAKDDPITFALWNREYSELKRNKQHKGYNVFYVHGHDSQEPTHENIINLDGVLAKGIAANIGDYTGRVFATNGGPLSGVANEIAEAKLHARHQVILNKIDAIFAELQNRIGKENQHNNTEALDKAGKLITALQKARDKYEEQLKNGIPYLKAGFQFKRKCEHAIEDVRTVLERDLGWGDFLTNLLKTLMNVVIQVFTSNPNALFTANRSKAAVALDQMEVDLNLKHSP